TRAAAECHGILADLLAFPSAVHREAENDGGPETGGRTDQSAEVRSLPRSGRQGRATRPRPGRLKLRAGRTVPAEEAGPLHNFSGHDRRPQYRISEEKSA